MVKRKSCAGWFPSGKSFSKTAYNNKLYLLDDFTERSTVAGTVFTGDADLLGALGHFDTRDQKRLNIPTGYSKLDLLYAVKKCV